MKISVLPFLFFFTTIGARAQMQTPFQAVSSEVALQQVIEHGKQINVDKIRYAASTQNGRIKPFATLARETVLFLTGSYRRWDLDATQIYLTISSLESSVYAPILEIRSVDLRKKLGFTADKKHYSLADLESSRLQDLAMPLLQKDQDGGKLDENEKKITETFSQMNLFRQLALKEHFPTSLDFSWLEKKESLANSTVALVARQYLDLLSQKKFSEAAILSEELAEKTRTQDAPELFRHAFSKLKLEVLFYDLRLFLLASLLALLSGLLMILDITRKKLGTRSIYFLFALVKAPIILGLAIRVYITQFAPITNMYGTMIWVAFGVSLFSLILYSLYKNVVMTGFMFLGSGLILMLTENIPLILSPDMDPIVAVLRSNFWLSTHVTTITISYAAYTIAMILGNLVLVQALLGKLKSEQIQEFFHYAYRMVQLGCFLLTVGIILGGVWADYSWGRFWGWDPKETWALIADLGFLVLLHARYIGWLSQFGFLALLPVSYLLVVMAWYGVNFILAAGLHSYGFSSGGARAVGIFVGIQLLLIVVAFLRIKLSTRPEKLMMK